MEKIALICLYAMTALSLLTGCSNSIGNGNKNLGSVELREYRDVKVNMPSVIVIDAEVESRINQVLNQSPSEEELNRPAQEGDVVNINYVGKQDGVEFTGGTDTGYDLTLGSGRFTEGFKDGLVGAKRGSKKELSLTPLEAYSEETLAGKPVVFEVTVNVVKEKKDAVLNDAFVQRASNYKTVDEHKESTEVDLPKQKQQSADFQVQQSVPQQVVEGLTFKLDKTVLSRRCNTRVRQYEEQVKMYGSSLSHMAQANGMDAPGLQEATYASMKDDVQNRPVINMVAECEGIVLEDADRQAFAKINRQDVEDAVTYHGQETFDEMAPNYRVMKLMADDTSNVAETAGTEVSVAETAIGATAVEGTTAAK